MTMVCGRCLNTFPDGSVPIETPCPVCDPDATLLRKLQSEGFDKCYELESGGVKVRCAQCEALVVQGIAIHEHGCPNEKKNRRQHIDDGDAD